LTFLKKDIKFKKGVNMRYNVIFIIFFGFNVFGYWENNGNLICGAENYQRTPPYSFRWFWWRDY